MLVLMEFYLISVSLSKSYPFNLMFKKKMFHRSHYESLYSLKFDNSIVVSVTLFNEVLKLILINFIRWNKVSQNQF